MTFYYLYLKKLWISLYDKNKDGKVSAEEFDYLLLKSFEKKVIYKNIFL